MGLNFFKNIFGKSKNVEFLEDPETVSNEIDELNQQISVRELAYSICVQRIARAVSKCSFETYRNHEEVKKKLFYRLNVAPNPNQNATEFWMAFIDKLYQEQEALIICDKEQYYLADSYSLDDQNALTDWSFENVTVGNFTFYKKFRMSDVWFFRLNSQNVKKYLESITDLYGKLISLSYRGYKKAQGRKFKLKIDRVQQNQKRDDDYRESLKLSLKTFMDDDDGVFIEHEGHELQEVNASGSRASSANGSTTRDITALLDDVLVMTCKAFLIPTNIVTGEVTDTSKAVDDFLTFTLDALVELIEDEINRKYYKPEEYLRGTYLRINTSTIKHVDILDMATSIDKLLSSGVMTINDIKKVLREEPIQEEFANKHYMTKNYSPIDELANVLEEDKKTTGKEEKPDEKQSNDEDQHATQPENGKRGRL